MTNEVDRPPSPPPGVAERLKTLRDLYVAETDQEARARLERERPRTERPFPLLVASRLQELRALCDLATHLHRAPTKLKPLSPTLSSARQLLLAAPERTK